MIPRHLLATILYSVILRANAFSYKDAKNWGKKYPECDGKRQSPVILKPNGNVGFPSIDENLQIINFNKLPTKVTMRNTGHTVEVKADWSGERPKIGGGPFQDDYVFEKLTFHWSQKEWTEGVVHKPDSKSTVDTIDMEMHMFFYKISLKSFEKAQSHKDGLAVLNWWFKANHSSHNDFLDEIEKNLHKVQKPNSTEVIPPIMLADILGDFPAPFVSYEGSLDYPPCSESVTWFIFDGEISIPYSLLNEFRKIKLAEGDKSNVRPIQPLNKRQPKSLMSDTYDNQ